MSYLDVMDLDFGRSAIHSGRKADILDKRLSGLVAWSSSSRATVERSSGGRLLLEASLLEWSRSSLVNWRVVFGGKTAVAIDSAEGRAVRSVGLRWGLCWWRWIGFIAEHGRSGTCTVLRSGGQSTTT